MPRVPRSPEFVAHCFKELNLGILEPPGLSKLLPSKSLGPGGSRDNGQKQVKLCSPVGLLSSNTLPSPFLGSCHCTPSFSGDPSDCSRKPGNTEHGGRRANLQSRELTCLQTLGCSGSPAQREFVELHHWPLTSENGARLPGRESRPWQQQQTPASRY